LPHKHKRFSRYFGAMRRVLHVLQSVPVIFQRLPKPAGNSVRAFQPSGVFLKKSDSELILLFGKTLKERAMENPLALITSLASGKNSNEFKGVVKQDWTPTGRIDFATNLSDADPDQPGEFRLLVEEHRIVESIAGNENLEIQWRAATLKEAKFVTTHYHKYLAENSLIKSPFEPDILPPEPKKKRT